MSGLDFGNHVRVGGGGCGNGKETCGPLNKNLLGKMLHYGIIIPQLRLCGGNFALPPMRTAHGAAAEEEELGGVIAWLVVDVDVRGKVGGLAFVVPPLVLAPSSSASEEDGCVVASLHRCVVASLRRCRA